MLEKGVSIINEEIKNKITTKNIYKILNQFIIPTLSKEERAFLEELEDYLINNVEPKIDLTKEVYPLFEELGKVNLLQRINPHGMRRVGFRYEIILAICLSILDPELDLARVVSGIIFSNPLFQFGIENEKIKKIFESVISGKKIGSLCITERERGSDAVHMQSSIKENQDGSLIFNGEKVFITNGPVADYYLAFGVSDLSNPRGTMYQVIIDREFEGIETHRIGIPSLPRVQVGQVIFKNVNIPKENILGGRGQGYSNLFNGLVAERGAIIGSSLGIGWLVAVSALIYTNFRKQFGKTIFEFQSVSDPLTKLFVELMSATEMGFKTASLYEKFIQSTKYEGRRDIVKFNAAFSSGTKYLSANLAHKIAYESQQLCGGIAYSDNLKIDRALNVARVQEIIGGSRNIQLRIVASSIRDMIKKL